MKARTIFTHLAAVLSFAASPVVLAQTVTPMPGDMATAKLLECMKMPAGSTQQADCMNAVKSLQAQSQAHSAQLNTQAAQMQAKAAQAQAKAAQAQAQPAPAQAQAAQAMAQAAAPKAMQIQTQPAAPAKPATAPPKPTPLPPTPVKAAPPPVPADVKAAAQATGLAGIQPPAGSNLAAIGGVGGAVSVKDISGLDLETAMMMVQSQRANVLESQLKDQVSAVQKRNEQIKTANATIVLINELLAGFGSGGKETATIKEAAKGNVKTGSFTTINANLAGLGLKSPGVSETTTKAQLNATVQGLKAYIDTQSNSQQMDMLKLQSLTNKRNEAFDLMTNFIKKMADSRSSVLGNMR